MGFSFTLGIVLLTCLQTANSWSGHVCQRKKVVYYHENTCNCHFIWCCGHKEVAYTKYVWEDYCCPGWSDSHGYQICNQPICSPSCQNGGVCDAPFHCRCPAGYKGDTCNEISACSHLKPCFPGACYGNSQCRCSDGFDGPSCLTLTGDQFKPVILKSNSTFTFHSVTKDKDVYTYMTDATDKTITDVTWTNQARFNVLEFNLEASIDTKFAFSKIPPAPAYVGQHKFGIVAASIQIYHKKLTKNGLQTAVSKTLTCNEPSNSNPISNTAMKCYKKDNNIIQLDSGDRYTLHFSVTTGGFRRLVRADTGQSYQTNIYNGISRENVMEFRFDYDNPYHCSEPLYNDCHGSEVPLELQKDVTKEPLMPYWSGWKDKLSGVYRYSFEVWKMQYSFDYNGLKEPDITSTVNPVPVFIKELLAENLTSNFPEYEPNEPGVYSTILEANDRANNSKYARRIAIFDKTSTISIIPPNPLYVTSALESTNYTWQTDLNGGINVSWTGHFVNELHEKGHFLSKVLDYTPRLDDHESRHDYKKITQALDDNDGKRNKSAIPNLNTIVRFEINYGRVVADVPKLDWSEVLPLNDKTHLSLHRQNLRDGDSVQIWIRAYDVMGNTKVDSTVVNFDNSIPNLFDPDIKLNVSDGKTPFSSRVMVRAKDGDSGIRKVRFTFTVNRTGEVKHTEDFEIEPKNRNACRSSRQPGCYCITMGNCFLSTLPIEFNNCWLKVPINKVPHEFILLNITVYNSAMLSDSIVKEIDWISKLTGIKNYSSPQDIEIVRNTGTSLRIRWKDAPSCYDRAGFQIVLFQQDNTSQIFHVDKEAKFYDIIGLSPLTTYWFKMYTKYGDSSFNVSSIDPAVMPFKTAKQEGGLSAGGVAGLVVGFIVILVAAVLVLLFLGRTGRLQPAKERVPNGIRNIRNTIRYRASVNAYTNRASYSKEDDDIYFYGGMALSSEKSMVISRKDLSLESELAQGRFAVIFLAKLYSKKEVKEVVAKTLKDDQNQEAIMKMRAKINFYADKVGHHKNVLDFIGNVEDDVRGPIMILEFCCKGVLKDFLKTTKTNVTVDLEERLFRMVFGICLGMDYLASRKVVHRRLAARNILLNDLYEPKITGFGPNPDLDDDNDDKEDNERIPIKWMAPECMKSTKHADELSDVWSYGIVMWEIFSLGETPYPGIQSRDVPTRLKQGYKMKKPEYCDDQFYKVMLKCWHYDPKKRQGFTKIKEQLDTLFSEGPGEEYYYRSNDF